jgi:hypothetical protein
MNLMRAEINKHAMHFGLYLGLFLSVKFFLTMTQNAFLGFLAFIMWISIPILLYWVSKKFRDEKLDGTMTFSQAWLLNFWIFFYGGMILEVVQFVYFQFINKTFLADSLQQSLQMMDKMNMAMPQQNIDMMEKIMTHPNLYVLTDFTIYTLISGSILSLLIAAIVKRTANPFK